MFKELFRAECSSRDYKNVTAAIKAATGKDDFLGFEEAEEPEKEFQKAIRDGFIEFAPGVVIVNADLGE